MTRVAQSKYLVQPLNQIDNDWPKIHRNIKRLQRVWGQLVKMLRREGVDTQMSEMFYRLVVQAVPLFGSDSWVVLAAMERTVKCAPTGLLIQITGKQARRDPDETWVTLAVGEVMGASGMQSVATYIVRRQGMVSQWMVMIPIFEVLTR